MSESAGGNIDMVKTLETDGRSHRSRNLDVMRQRVTQESVHHVTKEIPARSFLIKEPGTMMGSGVINWTPGILVLGGDMGDAILSHHSFNTVEAALDFVATRTDIDYILSKSNFRKVYSDEAAREMIRSRLDDTTQLWEEGEDVIGKGMHPWRVALEEAGPVRLIPNLYYLPGDTKKRHEPADEAHAARVEALIAEFIASAKGRDAILDMLDVSSPHEFIEVCRDIFQTDEVDFEGTTDYPESAKQRILIMQVFAQKVLRDMAPVPAVDAAIDGPTPG